MHDVLVTRPIPQIGLDELAPSCNLEVLDDVPRTAAELAQRVRAKDAILCLLTEPIDATVLAAGPHLRVVANMAVGYDNIDVASATRLGIWVTNTPGVLTETTADLAFALLLATARRVVEADAWVRAGHFRRWEPNCFVGQDVHGKTLGILGLGRIGQALAHRARAGFGMSIRYCSPRSVPQAEQELGAIRCANPAELLGTCDFVSIHAPSRSSTRHLIGAAELAQARPGSILINTARGPIVDEEALVAALTNGPLGGAGLDVYEHEPNLHPGLTTLRNVVLLPHIGSATHDTRAAMATMAATNLLAALAGEVPSHAVNPELASSPQRRRPQRKR